MLVNQHAGLMAETSMLVSWLRPACGLMVETSMLVSWLRPDPHAGLKVEVVDGKVLNHETMSL